MVSSREIIKNDGLKNYLLDLLFPNRCPFCNNFIAYNMLCCEKCFDNVLWSDESICIKCGKSVLKGCNCSENIRYDMCITAAYYADTAKSCIYNLKFRQNTNGAEIFGRVLRDRLIKLNIFDEIDIITAVPMTKHRRKDRGYNQSELIANAIIKGSSIPADYSLLTRAHAKTEQHLLSAAERKEAVGKQYKAANADLMGKTVLLVDDVLTTGSTLNFCSGLLKDELNAKKVICAAASTV